MFYLCLLDSTSEEMWYFVTSQTTIRRDHGLPAALLSCSRRTASVSAVGPLVRCGLSSPSPSPALCTTLLPETDVSQTMTRNQTNNPKIETRDRSAVVLISGRRTASASATVPIACCRLTRAIVSTSSCRRSGPIGLQRPNAAGRCAAYCAFSFSLS